MQNNWKVYIVLLLMKIEKLSNSGHCWYTRDQFTLLIYLSSHCWSTWVQFTLLVFLSSVCTADLFEISSLCWSPWVQFYQGWSCLNSSSSSALSLLLLNFSDFFPCIISPLCHLPLEDWPNLAGTETILKIIPLWIFNVSYNHYPMLRYSLSCCPSFQIGVCV